MKLVGTLPSQFTPLAWDLCSHFSHCRNPSPSFSPSLAVTERRVSFRQGDRHARPHACPPHPTPGQRALQPRLQRCAAAACTPGCTCRPRQRPSPADKQASNVTFSGGASFVVQE
eukprot:145965-Chlamydomonas_euryale.AAC.5